MRNDHDVRNQSNEEWLAEYSGGHVEKIIPAVTEEKQIEQLFRYVDHRTVQKDSRTSVVMEFESLDQRIHAVKFFNVRLTSGRKPYPAGKRGQFNPPERGAFRKFWMGVVGKPPDRWCRVHVQMRSQLSDLVFVGTLVDGIGKNGSTYKKVAEIQVKN